MHERKRRLAEGELQ